MSSLLKKEVNRELKRTQEKKIYLKKQSLIFPVEKGNNRD